MKLEVLGNCRYGNFGFLVLYAIMNVFNTENKGHATVIRKTCLHEMAKVHKLFFSNVIAYI